MRFDHEVIDASPPCGRLFVCQHTDLTGNGRPDLIVGGMGFEKLSDHLGPYPGGIPLVPRLFRRLETDLFWYENPGWERHVISSRSDLRALGSALGDVNGNGRADLIVGQGYRANDIYWYEQPENPRQPWPEHLVASDFEKYHDLAFGDIDNDGDPEIVGASQDSETVFYYDVPEDPYQSPWPDECRNVIARDTNVEGLEIVDIDGDGLNELVAGTSIYRQQAVAETDRPMDSIEADGGQENVADGWHREDVVTGWDWTRVEAGDVDGDGELELVFTEGDSPLLGNHMGRVGWFDPPDWTAHILRDDLYCPHSVQLADFDGNGRLDIYVAEMGLGEHDSEAEHLLFRNQGNGRFEETVIERGVPTHEAKAVDIDGDGRIDIVGKSYEPNTHVDVWYNRA
ncbi:FG-GAP repeat domain-containing protein [Natronomonas sp.]|uniref:FG-GAP repeat domain-containing protein n=1 Tax=Natronomonas sp. TaxID=2184060 RepID=UPI002FC30E52